MISFEEVNIIIRNYKKQLKLDRKVIRFFNKIDCILSKDILVRLKDENKIKLSELKIYNEYKKVHLSKNENGEVYFEGNWYNYYYYTDNVINEKNIEKYKNKCLEFMTKYEKFNDNYYLNFCNNSLIKIKFLEKYII